MSPVHRSVLTSAEAWSRLEPIIERFEEAWLAGGRPELDQFLAPDEPERDSLLQELVQTDLECRIKIGLQARVETYVERYPELARAPARVVELIETEFNLRRRVEPDLSADEYLGRFPDLREQLSSRLSSAPQRVLEVPPDRFDCPNCQHAIPLPDGATPGNLTCPSCGQSFRVDPAHTRPGLTRIGKFLLEAIVGKGSFGTVYRARDPELDRVVALKVPRTVWSGPAEEDRFFREARAAAQLSHPGIVPIFDVNRAGDCPYLVSGFVDGRTLTEILKERRLGFREAAVLIADVADAVEHAHQRKVVHRDLKPSNIMLGRLTAPARAANGTGPKAAGERPFVMDFGLARRDEGEVSVTLDGEVLGTPAYMSPEQARGHGHRADPRSDVYSLGVILYELLTGELPFRGVARMMLYQIQYDDPRPPRKLNDRIPRDLETVTLKCLEKEPVRRYPSGGGLRDDIRRFLEGKPTLARPAGWAERVLRWVKRSPWKAAALGLLVLLTGGSTGAAFYIQGQRRIAEEARETAEEWTEFAKEQHGKAEERLQLSLETIRDVVFDLQEKLADKPILADLRESLLQTAKHGVDRIAHTSKEHAAHLTMAVISLRQGDIDRALGNFEEARRHYLRGHEIVEKVRLAAPGRAGASPVLRDSHVLLGDVSRNQGDNTQAREHYELALAAARESVAKFPKSQLDAHMLCWILMKSGEAHVQLGDLASSGKLFEEARDCARRLAEQPLRSPRVERLVRTDLATVYAKLAELAFRRKDLDGVRENCRNTIATADDLLRLYPKGSEGPRFAATALELLGDLSLWLGDPASAQDYYRKALARREELLKLDPLRSGNLHSHALIQARLGDAFSRTGDAGLARQYFEMAIGQFEKYFGETGSDTLARGDLARAQERLGLLLRRMGRPDEASALFVKVLKHREDLAAYDAKGSQARVILSACHLNLGLCDLDRHDFTAAEKWFTRGLAVLDGLEKAGLGREHFQYEELARLHRKFAGISAAAPLAVQDLNFLLAQPAALVPDLLRCRMRALAARGEHHDAAAAAERLLQLRAEDVATQVDVAMVYGVCASKVGPKESQTRQNYDRRALDMLAEVVRQGYPDAVKLGAHPDFAALRADERFQKLLGEVKEELRKPKPTKAG